METRTPPSIQNRRTREDVQSQLSMEDSKVYSTPALSQGSGGKTELKSELDDSTRESGP